ncbi:MAG: hypothetical protein Kow00108_15760 [Calditrichia bacterium]
MEEELSRHQYQSLLNSVALLNSKMTIDEILEVVMREITQQLQADRSTLYIVDRKNEELWSKIVQGEEKLTITLPIGTGVAGWVAKEGKMVNISDAYQDNRFNPEVDKKSGYRTESILCVPVKARNGRVIAVMQVLNKKSGKFHKSDELFLSLYAEHVAIAIQNALYFKQAMEKQRMERELKITAELQRFFLKKENMKSVQFEINQQVTNMFYVGGDFIYSWRHKGDIYFLLADVMGHGVGAALVSANLQGILYMLRDRSLHMLQLVKHLNRHVLNLYGGKKFITGILGRIHEDSGLITYVRCGHVYPIIIKPIGEEPYYEILKSQGPPLGIREEAEFETKSVKLNAGDIFFSCSDGLLENPAQLQKSLSLEEVGAFLLANHFHPVNQLTQILLRDLPLGHASKCKEDDCMIFLMKKV